MPESFKLQLEDLYFDEPRLKMSNSSRFLIRLIIYTFYAILAIAAVIFLISDASRLFFLGIFIFLFLAERLIHLGDADRSIVGLTRYLPRLSRRKEEDSPKRLNVSVFLTPKSFGIAEKSFEKALILGGSFYLYLLKFLIEQSDIRRGLLKLDVDLKEFEKKINDLVDSDYFSEVKDSKNDLLVKMEILMKAAFLFAVDGKNKFIDPWDLFSALSSVNDEAVAKIFGFFSINTDDFSNAMIFSRFSFGFGFWKSFPVSLGEFASRSRRLRHRTMNRAWTAKPTPILDKFSVDFTDLAREGKSGFLIGHKNEYDRLVDILSRPSKPNALLVGEAGSGKETLIAALAFGIIKDEVPAAIFDKRLVSLEINRLISGASSEEISKRINQVAQEIILAGNVILYIPDIHNLTKTSKDGAINASDVLMPVINGDAFPVIGATYPKEFKDYIEAQSDLKNSFEVIRVEELSEEEAIRVLTYESLILERKYNLSISFGAVKQSVILAHKFFRDRLLPSSAQDLLKEGISSVSAKGSKLLKADDIISVVERKINVPIRKADKEEAEKLLNLEQFIHQNFIDQEEAVKAVSRALREYRSGLSRKGGPIAAFLFVGPTGVGKTELAKILAKIQFGSEEAMLRFDMSEYQNKESIFRFLGGVDGNISGNLAESVMQKPYSLVLLDEFEKANADILNLFLQIFDDGRLTDSLGRKVDFTNTIIVATSNAHSEYIKDRLEAGDGIEKINENLKRKLTEIFKPELINRFSEIVAFKNLSQADTEEIAKLQMKSLAKTLEETNGIMLNFDDEAVKMIARLGYDPVFGARPLRAVISNSVKSVLAEEILKGKIAKGNSVKIIFKDNKFDFINV